MSDLRYPIGPLELVADPSPEQITDWIAQIAAAPSCLRQAVADLSPAQTATPYRPGGWTVRQLVHHVADSHLNAYVRFKLALTEEAPTIKPYDQDRWAALADVDLAPMETSLLLLDALHERWVALLGSLTPADFDRTFRHPEMGVIGLGTNLGLYAWHGRHHVAHVTALRERSGW